MPFERLNRSQLKLLPLSERESKIVVNKDIRVSGYYELELNDLAARILNARFIKRKPIIWFMGAHVMREGNAPIIVDLMRRGFITHLATNGAVPIHDFEMAYQGKTLEDVEHYIKDGKFGNWMETGSLINKAVSDGLVFQMGFGESVGRMLVKNNFPNNDASIFANAFNLGIPATVHKGIGCDITDQHPMADYAALGAASGMDFLIFANTVSKLEGGGVFLNLGCETIGPEVYLKALSMARNIAEQKGEKISNFTTAVFDLKNLGNWREDARIVDYKQDENLSDERYYFRPMKSILIRTVKEGGESFYIRGRFRETIPALYRQIVNLSKYSKAFSE